LSYSCEDRRQIAGARYIKIDGSRSIALWLGDDFYIDTLVEVLKQARVTLTTEDPSTHTLASGDWENH
jgi:hypothetical protein